jgi:hypothetical protein
MEVAVSNIDEGLPQKRPWGRWGRADTSAMSWRDCHIGYYFIGLACLATAFGFQSPSLAIVGFAAIMNGAYAVGFTARADGDYSSFLWWLAVPTSILSLFIATMLELNLGEKDGIGIGGLLALCVAGKLAFGQLMFLIRRRRERFASTFAREVSDT